MTKPETPTTAAGGSPLERGVRPLREVVDEFMGHQLTGRREAMTALQNLVDTAWDYARYTESLEQALLLLHGLHPCITTDDPETVAQAIFDTVLAQQKAQDRRIADLQRTIDYMLAQRPNIGVEQHAPC